MFTRNTKKARFNLLTLSENEHYFTDYSCILYPEARTEEESYRRQVKGRLKVCSKSLIFDPVDLSLPMIKYDYKAIVSITPVRDSLISRLDNTEIFQITTNMIVELKENNTIAPYVFKNVKTTHKFAIKYASQSAVLAEIGRLIAIAKLPSYESEEKINQIVMERESSVVFDMTWLETLDERPLLETFSTRVTPLVENAGRLMITDRMIYFQPFNNVDPNPVDKFPLRDVVRVIKRRHSLRHIGLEIFMTADSDVTSAFFTFKSQEQRDRVYDLVTTQPGMTKLEHENPLQTTLKWQSGLISNFEYLMYLNSLADRSFNDLTQYPVFPWIIADYTSRELDLNNPATFRDLSKPIGALNPERLAALKRRYQQMPDTEQKFLYGTHYSTPGYVLYYLVRKAPEYMLRLQNGRFDEPDRLFNSIEDTWKNVLNNPADLKELIPEFFIDGSFLVNSEGLNLGRKQDGTRVDNVALPAWASTPEEFIAKHREALESEYVSEHLNEWIDLIFGYKQQGEEALRADNLFHPLTYEGAVDIEKIADPRERQAILLQIKEFGQTPKKIFDKPHPKRFPKEERDRIRAASDTTSRISPPSAYPTSQVVAPSTTVANLHPLHGGNVSRTTRAYSDPSAKPPNSSSPVSSSRPNRGRTFGPRNTSISDFEEWGLTSSSSSNEVKEVSFGFLDPTPPAPLPGMLLDNTLDYLDSSFEVVSATPAILPDSGDRIICKSGWDKTHKLVPSQTFKLHRDIVTSICLPPGSNTLLTTSKDSTLKIYSLTEKRQLRSTSVSQLALSTCILTKNENCVLLSSWDNNIYVYSIDYGRVQDSLYAHDDAVSCLTMQGDVVVSGSWDSTVKAWKLTNSCLDKVPVANFSNLEAEVRCIDIDDTGELVIAGASDGTIALYDMRSKCPVRTWVSYSDQVSSVKWTPDGRIVSCGKDGCLRMQDQFGHDIMEIQLPDSHRCMITNGDRCLLGGEQACLRIWNLLTSEELARIPKKTNSSPISCLTPGPDCEFVVSGADDGTITIWESS